MKNTFKKHELFWRYLCSYLLLLLMPLVVLGVVVQRFFFSSLRNTLLEQSALLCEKAQSALYTQAKQMDSFAMQSVGDSNFSRRNIWENPTCYMDICRKLRYFQSVNGSVEDIYYHQDGMDYFFSTAGTINARFLFTSTDGTQLADMQEIFETLRTLPGPLWSNGPLYPNVSSRGIFYIFPLGEQQFIFRLSSAQLEETLTSAGGGDYPVLLLNAQGSVLYARHADECFLEAADQAHSNFSRWRCDGESYYLVRSSPKGAEPSLVFFIPVREITARMRLPGFVYFASLLAIVSLGSLVIYEQMKRCYNPLRELGQAARRLSPGLSENLNLIETAQRALESVGQARSPHEEEILREARIFRLLRGEYPNIDAFNADCEGLGLLLSGSAFQVAVFLTEWESDQAAGEVRIFEQLREMLSVDYEVFMLEYLEQQSFVFILSLPDPDARPALEQRLQLLLMHYQEAEGRSLTIGVSEPRSSTAQLLAAYNEACIAAKYQLIRGKNQVIFYADCRQETALEHYFYPKEELDSLYYAIVNGNTVKIQFIMQNLIARIRGEQQSLFLAICLFYDIINTALRATHTISQTYPSFEAKYQNLSANENLRSVEDFVGIVEQISEDIIAYLDQNRRGSKSLEAGDVAAYIREHFADADFCVKTLSDHFNMSISNFSHQFKSCMGQNVSAYINTLRIDTARILLSSTSMPVNDIAARVGYVQPSSFIRKFKQSIGQTPGEYRAAHEAQTVEAQDTLPPKE